MDRDEAIELILNPGRRPAPGSVEYQAFLAYLDRSPECRAMYQQQESVWEALDLWEDVEPSAGFDQRLREEALRSGGGFAGWRRWSAAFDQWTGGLRPAVALGLAALLLVAGAVVRWHPHPARDLLQSTAAPAVELEHLDQIDQALDDIEMLADFEALLAASGAPGES